MGKYIGPRVLPVHEGDWSENKSYESLSLVYDPESGNSYISRQNVPAGTPLTDEAYWAHSADFNAQLHTVREHMMRVYDNLEQLTSDKTLRVGDLCKTKGYYSPGDGGGGEYVISDTSKNSIISTATANGVYATLQCGNRINMLQVGVARNGQDQSARVQYIIDELSAIGIFGATKFELFFPYGEYTFNSGIKLTGRHDMCGEMVTYGDKDFQINGTKFYFDCPADTILIDASDNYRCTISNLYICSTGVVITEDRSKISTGDADGGVDVFTVTRNATGQTGILLQNYGSTLIDVVVRGVEWGVRAQTFNTLTRVYCWECDNAFSINSDCVCSELRAYDVGTFITISGANNILNNLRCDSVVTFGMLIVGGANTITNLNMDYVQWMAVHIRGGDDNYISGTIARCGTLYNNCTEYSDTNTSGTIVGDEAAKTCYVFLENAANNNRLDISCTPRNPLDKETEYKTPSRAIVSKGGNFHNDINLYGDRGGDELPQSVLDIVRLRKLYNPLNSNDIAYLRYKGRNYILSQVTHDYDADKVYVNPMTTLSGYYG